MEDSVENVITELCTEGGYIFKDSFTYSGTSHRQEIRLAVQFCQHCNTYTAPIPQVLHGELDAHVLLVDCPKISWHNLCVIRKKSRSLCRDMVSMITCYAKLCIIVVMRGEYFIRAAGWFTCCAGFCSCPFLRSLSAQTIDAVNFYLKIQWHGDQRNLICLWTWLSFVWRNYCALICTVACELSYCSVKNCWRLRFKWKCVK